jgi:aminopeptidase N
MIVAVGDFNMGAMENKGLNIFNTKFVLANPRTATDVDYAGIEAVVGHEYFHNWTGNRVTCRDWFQLSLKEGLTVFRDQEFSADMIGTDSGRAVTRIDQCAPAPGAVPGRRRPDGAPGASGLLRRDQQLLHRDRVRKRRGSGAHVPDLAGPRRLPQGHGPVLRAPRRPGR